MNYEDDGLAGVGVVLVCVRFDIASARCTIGIGIHCLLINGKQGFHVHSGSQKL